MAKDVTGGCQCGAVRYRIAGGVAVSYVCHCTDCQNQSASAFGISVPVWISNVSVEGTLQSWSKATDSGSVTDCYFCHVCGTRIYHDGHSRAGMVTIKGGTLDEAQDLQPVAHIWTASKQHWLDLPADVPQWTQQPRDMAEWAKLLNGGPSDD